MRISRILGASILMLLSIQVNAATIEFDLDYTLGPISGEFGNGQVLSGVGTSFPEQAFVFDVGDTLVFDILFNQKLAVIDVGPPTDEAFSFGLDILPSTPGFSGTWTSSIEALGAIGDTWTGPIVNSFIGGGSGFGWGGVGVNVTDSLGILSGIRWTTTLTSAQEGAPMTLYAFTGVQLSADGIAILASPVPAPATILLFSAGLIGLAGFRRHRKAA